KGCTPPNFPAILGLHHRGLRALIPPSHAPAFVSSMEGDAAFTPLRRSMGPGTCPIESGFIETHSTAVSFTLGCYGEPTHAPSVLQWHLICTISPFIRRA